MGGVCFSSREDPSGILLVLNTDSGGSLQYMELCEQERPLHTLFTNSSRTTRILQWQCMLVFNTNSRIVCICPTRNVWASASETGVPQHHLVIATAAGDLICLQRENMQQVCLLVDSCFLSSMSYFLFLLCIPLIGWTDQRVGKGQV